MHSNRASATDMTGGPIPPTNWATRPLKELIVHIVSHYHDAHRRDFPGLVDAAREVQSVHRDHELCPHGLAPFLEQFSTQLGMHMEREEAILFPAMIAGASGERVDMPVRVLMREHRHHDDNLRRLRELAHDFVLPADASDAWQTLYVALEELEASLQNHFALENDVLFPRALAD